MRKPELKEEQWAKLAAWLPEPRKSSKGGPTPVPNRPCFEGILWVLRSGARWKDLPDEYPSYSTCRRRLLEWEDQGLWLKLWRALLAELDEKQQGHRFGRDQGRPADRCAGRLSQITSPKQSANSLFQSFSHSATCFPAVREDHTYKPTPSHLTSLNREMAILGREPVPYVRSVPNGSKKERSDPPTRRDSLRTGRIIGLALRSWHV